MNYAIDFYEGDDWGAPVDSTDYDYGILADAVCEVTNWLLMEIDRGTSPDLIGATIVSEDRDEVDNPLVEEEFNPRNLGLVPLR